MNVTLTNKTHFHTYRLPILQFDPEDDCGVITDDLSLPPLASPIIYSLELTPSCNNRCSGCSNVFISDKETRLMMPTRRPMPLASWELILDKIAPFAQRLKLTGGEATSYPEFDQLLTGLKARNLSFTLFTNGRWKDPEQIINLLKETPQCLGLLISLHGADAQAHEAFTGVKGSFEETIQNIRLAADAGLTIHTNAVFTRYNAGQIKELVSLSHSLGAKCAVFNRYVGTPLPDLALSQLALMKAVREVDRVNEQGKKTKLGTCVPLCFVESSSTGCLAGTAYCTIDPWGNVRPCNHAPQMAGNLLHQSLDSVWRSNTMQAWRDLIPDECSTCSAFSTCHGGCRADMVLKGVQRDPLMTIPLPLYEPPKAKPRQLALYESAIPRLEYRLQEEAFGPILTQGNDIIPISPRARSILGAMNQQNTLRRFEDKFGEEAVHFIGQLYDKGAVSLSW